MLVGPEGLPARSGRIVSEEWLRARRSNIVIPGPTQCSKSTISDDEYPIPIAWDGLLTSESEESTADMEWSLKRRVDACLSYLFNDSAASISQSVAEALAVRSIQEYLHNPSQFFAHHLSRYSKTPRQAPIYWALSTASGSYSIWLYYHRLNEDSLYTALNKYVKPKIDATEKELRRIEAELLIATGRATVVLRTAFERTTGLLEELRDFRDELVRVAELPYRPNRNDGVLFSAAPLWKLFRLPKWRKDLQECWKKLEGREYEWSHLAYSIWPDRVREVCKRDRSIAIAHGLEQLCEVAAKPAKRRRSKKAEIEETVPGDEE
jgi:hypothetical protein